MYPPNIYVPISPKIFVPDIFVVATAVGLYPGDA